MKIYELLDSPEKWCQHYSSLDADGNLIRSTSTVAVKWCLIGAIHKCYRDADDVSRVGRTLFRRIGYVSVWNDEPSRTHAEVLALTRELDI